MTVTATRGDLTVTVDVPVDTGQAFDVTVSASSAHAGTAGQVVSETVHVNRNGSVSVA